MNLNTFNNLRFEYSMGATVLMISLVDTSLNNEVLNTTNVTKIRIEYSYDNINYTTVDNDLNFHINSDLIIITGLTADTDITFTPYLILEENGVIKHVIQITDTINEHTLPYGNIEKNIISSGDTTNDTIVSDKMDEILGYINALGTNIDINYNYYAKYAKTIPIRYNSSVQTAQAMYYKWYKKINSDNTYGLVETSGGAYFKNDTMFHELRHRFGITHFGSNIERSDDGEQSALFNYILDDYTVINDAIKFETGRLDAKCWIWMAHSNIPEGTYTNAGDYNYLAANYIKALAWYTCHNTTDEDTSKIRIIQPINLSVIMGDLEEDENEYNVVLQVSHGEATVNKSKAKYGEQIIISNLIPNNGYIFNSINVTSTSGNIINTTNNAASNIENMEIYFSMPDDDVIINIKFIYNSGTNNPSNTIIIDDESLKENESNINTRYNTINIGPYQYLYEFLKNDEDFHDVGCSDQFVILRNFEIVNEIVYDKDILFIEKTIYDKLINNLGDDLICYPLYKNGSLFFSNTYGFFTTYNFNLKDISYNIYTEIESNDEQNNITEANILCDKLRIYNPTINKNLDYIIYVDNYINNIHFHYFCNLNKNFNKKYTGEIKVNNNRYIEYIEINIPNIKKLFDDKNKYFIIEQYNKLAFEENFSIDNLFGKTNKNYDNKLYLSKMIKPFIIDKIVNDETKEVTYIKTFIDDKYFNYNNNFINTSLNITLYPYKNVSNGLYILHDIINSSSTFIAYENYFRLSSRLGFDNGVISLINEFIFPNKIKTDKLNKYDFNYEQNENESYTFRDKLKNDFTILEEAADKQVVEYYNTYYLHENLDNIEDLRDEFDEDLDIEAIRSTGFVIQFANDLYFNDIILESIINTDEYIPNENQNYVNNNDNFIYDFSFSLNNMVDAWSQLNDILVVRARFIDKRLNIVITGNNVVINKEWFKYFINDINYYNVKFNTEKSDINNLITNKFMDINKGFNFIDNINCTIVENTNNQQINTLNTSIINTKIVYKPIFYKVQELQNIRIRQGMTQNIGINLGAFLNKVTTFILNIGDQTIKESSRNDVFVIFQINANDIENNTGYYNIMNENFEFISSGNYIKY